MTTEKFQGTKRYDNMFANLAEKQQGAFVPFVMLGDPGKDESLEIIRTLIKSGADALELGIPYSDPIADGPTIQAASIRALDSGITPQDCLDIISTIRQEYPDIPVGLLMYSNLILAKGIDAFYKAASDAGVDSILIADVPIREAAPFTQIASAHNIQQILIAPPNATEETLTAIGELSCGYTYLLGRAGVTGTETAAAIPTATFVERLAKYNAAPPIIGFGISTPAQVKAAVNDGAAGAIAGSATVNIIAKHLDDKTKMHEELSQFVSSMKAATQR